MKRVIAILLASILLGLGIMSIARGAKIIANGATSQSISVVIFDADGEPNTTVTIANLDFWIVSDGHAPSAKIDLAALAGVGAAWDDYKAIHLQSGLYRIDIPDANLDDGIGTLLTIIIDDVVTSNRTVFYEIQLSPLVDVNTILGEAPLDAEARFDVLDEEVQDNNALITAVQSTVDTIDGTVDSILEDTAAQDEASEWTTLGAGIAGAVDFNDLFTMTPSKTATVDTVEWIFAWLRNWINSKR